MQTLQQQIGLRIRHRRMEVHLAGGELAALVGWKPDYLSRIERGRWRHIEPGKLIALADALQFSVDLLLGRAEV